MLPPYLPGSLRSPSGQFTGDLTLATGDLLVSIDGGALSARDALPDVVGGRFEIELTAEERAASRLLFVFHDQDGSEFADKRIVLVDDAPDLADAILSRSVQYVEASMPQHCLGTAILMLLEWALSADGSELYIKGTDGVTTRFTKTVASTPDPVNAITGVT